MQSVVAVSPYVKILFPDTILKVLSCAPQHPVYYHITFTHVYLVSLVSLKYSTVLCSLNYMELKWIFKCMLIFTDGFP